MGDWLAASITRGDSKWIWTSRFLSSSQVFQVLLFCNSWNPLFSPSQPQFFGLQTYVMFFWCLVQCLRTEPFKVFSSFGYIFFCYLFCKKFSTTLFFSCWMDLCVHCNLMVLQEFSPLPLFSVVYYLLVARLHPFRFVVYFPCSYQSLMSCGDLLFMNWSILKNWKEQSSSVWSVEWGLRLMDVKALPLLTSRWPCPRSHLLAL